MATKKAEGVPAFPHPPLETGVAQYPTPLVPNYNDKKGGWSINDQGHIILVEKVSIEKGSFNPQPLDGSVTYTGRDANKWPSSLYLVAEKPTPDGEFIYRYWANDRSLSSQDLWNYGKDYSANNPSFPITTRSYIVPRSQYSPVALGSTDPVFGGTEIVAQQKMVELAEDSPLYSRYVAVQVVYESIPGPTLSGARITDRGDTETIVTQTVGAGTNPTSDSLLVTQSSVQSVDSVKSTQTTGTVGSYAQLTTKANKSGLLGETSTTDDIVDPATSPDQLSTTIIDSSVEALTKTKSRKKTTTATGPTLLSGKSYNPGLQGKTETSESIVAYGTVPDSLTTSLLSSQVTPIDFYKSKKTNITSVGQNSLSGGEIKSGLLGKVVINETIVAAGSPPDSLTAYDSLTGAVIESKVTPIDEAKSKKTTITAFSPATLSGGSRKSGLLGNINTVESIVSYGSDPLHPSYGTDTLVVESSVVPIDETKSKQTDIISSGPLTLNGASYGEFGLIGTTEEIVPSSYTFTPSDTKNIKEDVVPIDASKSKHVKNSYLSLNTLTGYQYDADLNLNVTNTKIIVASGASLSTENGLLSSRDEPIDIYKTIRIQSKITQLPETRTEYKTGSYSSPNLITTYNITFLNTSNAETVVKVQPVMRAKRSYETVFKYETSYSYGPITEPSYSIFDPLAVNVYLDSFLFQVNIPDALTDAYGPYTVYTLPNNPTYGYIGDTFAIAATTPTATEYIGYLGSFKLISYQVDYWKANIYRTSQISVLLK